MSPLASPAPSERAMSPVGSSSPAPVLSSSTAGVTKEEKAAEMARRKEERKQVRCLAFVALFFSLSFLC
jgi:SCY1-like protein 1